MIMCEQCGEATAVAHGGHASLCEDCFSTAILVAIQTDGLGYYCCTLLKRENGQMALCLEPYGSEHDHNGGMI